VIADELGLADGGVLTRGLDGRVGSLLLLAADLLALLGEFGNARLDLVGTVAQPAQIGFLFQDHARGLEIKQPLLDLVDALKILDLDRSLALLEGQLLLDRLRVRGLGLAQLGVAHPAGPLELEAVDLLGVLKRPARGILLVIEPALVKLGLPSQPLLVFFPVALERLLDGFLL